MARPRQIKTFLVNLAITSAALITAVITAFVLAYYFRESLLLRGSQGILHHLTGFRNTVQEAEFLSGSRGICLRNVIFRNPAVFRERPEFARIREILVEFEKPLWSNGTIQIKRLFMDVEIVHVVLWDRDSINLSYLSGMRQNTESAIGLETLEDQETVNSQKQANIRSFELKISQVEFTDTTGRRRSVSTKFTEERNHKFENLVGANDVIRSFTALVIIDRPIPSEKLPIGNQIAILRKAVPQQDVLEAKATDAPSEVGRSISSQIFTSDLPSEAPVNRPEEMDLTMQEDEILPPEYTPEESPPTTNVP